MNLSDSLKLVSYTEAVQGSGHCRVNINRLGFLYRNASFWNHVMSAKRCKAWPRHGISLAASVKLESRDVGQAVQSMAEGSKSVSGYGLTQRRAMLRACTMQDGSDLVDHLSAAMLLMPLAAAVCFVSWRALRALVWEAGKPLGPGLKAPDACDTVALPAAVVFDHRPRQAPADGMGQALSSGQQGRARLRRRSASPAARSAQAPDDPYEREGSHAPKLSTTRRRSRAPSPPQRTQERSETQGSASRRGTNHDGARSVHLAGATETRDVSGDDTSQGDDDRFVTRPRPGAAADVTEANSALLRAVIEEYAQRFDARVREGWVQKTREPAGEPTPSTLRAQRQRARMAVM